MHAYHKGMIHAKSCPTGAYGDKRFFSDLQVLGCQPGKESCVQQAYAMKRAQQERQKHGKYNLHSMFRLNTSAIYTQYILANQGRRHLV